MKFWVRLFALICFVVSITGCTMFAEQPSYVSVEKDDPFELRDYRELIVAETEVSAALEDAGGEAFQRLFEYISGENKTQEGISMTSPVTQTPASEEIAMTAPVGQRETETGWIVSFIMPDSYTLETLPQPTNPDVTLRVLPSRRVAVIRYSGTWSDERYREHLARLNQWIEQQNLEITGDPIWARYNPPFTPWFMRRNEIMMPVAD